MDDEIKAKKDTRRRIGFQKVRKKVAPVKIGETVAIDSVDDGKTQLSSEDIEIANSIKIKLRRTAETIVEIGLDILKAVNNKPKGYKELFYNEIGMSTRSAQRYMQIANNEKVLELQNNMQLEGKTMTDLMHIITKPTQTKNSTFDAVKVANGFYSKYKNKPDELKEIIVQLQQLIDNAQLSE